VEGARGEPLAGRLSSILRLAAEVESWAQGGLGGASKPREEVADLLIMSTLDQKTPPPTEGSGDLLDALVENHLARGESAAANAGAAGDGEPVVEAQTLAPGDTEGHGMDVEEGVMLLQKEIETLLRGDATEAPVVEALPAEENMHIGAPALAKAAPEQMQVADAATMTPAELEALLASPAAVEQERSQQGAVVGAPAGEEDETSRQLSEAEGVLAAELAQLMADSDTAEAPAAAEEAAPAVVAPVAPVETAAAVAPVVAEVKGEAAGVVAQLPPPVVVELAETEGASEPAGALPRRGLLGRVKELVGNVVLLMAQLIDMPFTWMDELDKNVMGVVALVLLLSGCVMYWLAMLYR